MTNNMDKPLINIKLKLFQIDSSKLKDQSKMIIKDIHSRLRHPSNLD